MKPDPAQIAASLTDALTKFDEAAAKCPARKRFLGPSPCPVCRAGPRDGCGKEIGAAFDVVSSVRAALEKMEQSQ